MKKIKNIQKLLMLLLAATISISNVISQDVGVLAQYDPPQFTGYPIAGNFKITLTKLGATIPANNFSIIIALEPKVSWTLAACTIPTGFALSQTSTSTQLVIVQTGEYTGSGVTGANSSVREFSIPVKSTGPVGPGPESNYRVNIQQDGFGYSDPNSINDASSSRVTVADNPLPVVISAFNVIKENTTAHLIWSTTEELNSERFDVEHSLNGKNWNILGSVKAKGESRITEKYLYIHEEPSNGENLYRLKMMDKDGSFAYSRIQSVTFENIQTNSMVFPNPATDLLKLSVKDLAEVKTVKMFDLNGTPVYSVSGNALTKNIDIRKYPTGTYVVEIAGKNGQVKASKIVIIR